MGNNSSAVACGAPPVTANPTTARLSDRDVTNLRHLYGHDDELLQLMCGAELLRDCVKNVRDNATVYFTAMTQAARRESEFGDKLAATADRNNTSGMTLSIPANPSADAEGEIGNGGEAAAAPIAGGGAKRAVGSDETQDPHLQRVLEVQSLIGRFAVAQSASADHLADFVKTFIGKLNAVADEVEKAHHTKLERQAP